MQQINAKEKSSLTNYVNALCDPVHRSLCKILRREIAHAERADEGKHKDRDKRGLLKLGGDDAEDCVHDSESRNHKTDKYEGSAEYRGSNGKRSVLALLVREHCKNADTRKQTVLLSLFALPSIIIPLMGVFGIVIFETQYRRREIGIRRVHGASVGGILRMFNRKYLYIVAICSAVAIPISYYIIDQWMQQYVYRTPMSWWVYALAVGVILAITVVTVTLRSFKAATENPTESIMR